MQIDLFTLIAQIVNFLILVGVLWHFLFGRIVKVLNNREEQIASRIEEAEQKKKEADQEKAEHTKKIQELEQKREEIMSQARSEGDEKRKEILQVAREEAKANKAKWQHSLEQQKKSFLKELRKRAGEQIYAIARRTLKDLANEDMEKHAIEVFMKRLEELGEDEMKELTKLAQKSDAGMLIISAFDIPDEMRQKIGELVEGQLGSDVDIKFETEPELISGVELRAGGKRISWSMADYLNSLEEQMSKAFDGEIKGAEVDAGEK